jgi:hypothetical protein
MKGRNTNLIQLRNMHLIRRYYYWYEIERKRIDDVLDILSTQEVFLDTDYILHIVRQHRHLLKQIKLAKPKQNKVNDFEFTNIIMPEMVNGDLFATAG